MALPPEEARERQRASWRNFMRRKRLADREGVNAKQRKWWARSGHPSMTRKWSMKTRYGVTPAEYDRMLAAQGGGCWVCGATTSGTTRTDRLYIEHNHGSGAVRALTCHACNQGIAWYERLGGALMERIRLYLEITKDGAVASYVSPAAQAVP